ncbi:hypothetical protein U0070_016434 [Myodes glareolus]|uniref:Uncharacterized protein n=1 Tax=Myodes glareolus TaxID=447135 RepID=A0AAW0JZ10_MYOGA
MAQFIRKLTEKTLALLNAALSFLQLSDGEEKSQVLIGGFQELTAKEAMLNGSVATEVSSANLRNELQQRMHDRRLRTGTHTRTKIPKLRLRKVRSIHVTQDVDCTQYWQKLALALRSSFSNSTLLFPSRGQLVDVGNLAQGFTLGTRHLYQMGHLTVPVTLLSK